MYGLLVNRATLVPSVLLVLPPALCAQPDHMLPLDLLLALRVLLAKLVLLDLLI